MEIIKTRSELRKYLENKRINHSAIGFVPTMGALHQGHISLISQSAAQNDLTVVSIFVNPRQFNDRNDFEKYPRNIDADIKLLEYSGCNVLFLPEYNDIFTKDLPVALDLDGLDAIWEGAFRPGHFKGVVDVVDALFDAVQPHKAYFGRKDFQQLLIIRKLAEQYYPTIEIVECKIVREPDGLAMSSRNARLDGEGRKAAGSINRILSECQVMAVQHATVKQVADFAMNSLQLVPGLKTEYIAVCDKNTLFSAPAEKSACGYMLLVAVWCAGVRLIDNFYLKG